MDKASKRKHAEAVRRAFSRLMKTSGYSRAKTAFWVIPSEHVIQFVHLHLFSYMPAFRVHFGVRVLNDDSPAVALNGPSSNDGWAQGKRRYVCEYSEGDGAIQQCATELAAYVNDIGRPWFEQFRDPAQLLHAPASPLQPGEKSALEQSILHERNDDRIHRSKALLGVSAPRRM